MTTKHTPGPLTVRYFWEGLFDILASDGTWVARVRGEQNAKLMAAAHELFEALKKCEHALVEATPFKEEDPYLQAHAIVFAREAIAKAGGEV